MPSSNGPLHGTREKLSNKPRDRGISPPQRSVQEFTEGQKVHLKIDPSSPKGRFHPRFNGQTGEIVGKQGRAFKVLIDDRGKEKTLIARSVHLRPQQ